MTLGFGSSMFMDEKEILYLIFLITLLDLHKSVHLFLSFTLEITNICLVNFWDM